MKRTNLNYTKVDQIILSPKEDSEYIIQYDGTWKNQKVLTVTLEVPNISCKLLCGYKTGQGEIFDLATILIHKAPNTSCDTVVRGVLFDGGTSKYVGTIMINKNAQGAYSQLDDKVLVVGEGTRNHAEPVLQIEANDVTASHSASTGRVDKNQLYYLQSRGLSTKESEELLVGAFLASVV